jgi:AcrR family transcriptional regulator
LARTLAKDHDDRRKLILDSAAEVFASSGIVGASMNEVASACGISKANIYHYYSSKNDLVFDILDTYLSELRDVICGLNMTTLSPPQQLHKLIETFLIIYEGMDNEHKIQTEGIPLLQPDQQKVLRNYQRDLVACVFDVLAQCAPETLGQNKTKCRDVTMSVFGMINWFYMWNAGASKAERKAYAKTISDLTLNGISERVPA